MSIKLPRMDFQMKSEVPIWQHGDRKEEDEMMKRTRDEDEENKNRPSKTKIKGISRDQLKMLLDPLRPSA